MTKKEFILQAMLQLAGSGTYKDSWENNCRISKEMQIFNDAVDLASVAEYNLQSGNTPVFEEENLA